MLSPNRPLHPRVRREALCGLLDTCVPLRLLTGADIGRAGFCPAPSQYRTPDPVLACNLFSKGHSNEELSGSPLWASQRNIV